MEFPNFSGDKFLPENSKVLLMGTGNSIRCNIHNIIDFIIKNKPIIIALNGYLYGILHLEKNGVLDQYTNSLKFLTPNVLFVNYLLQGESRYPDGRRRTIDRRSHNRFATELTEPKFKNLFYTHIVDLKDYILKNNIYMLCASSQDKKLPTRGNLDEWGYDKYKKFDLMPKSNLLNVKLKEVAESLSELYDDSGVKYKPEHLGEFVLSWLHYNKISSLAVCGINDNYAVNNKIIPWFWSDMIPGLGKFKPSMLKANRIFAMYEKEYGPNFINLNLIN